MKINLPIKINIPVRFRNPWFWVGLGGVALTAMGVSPEMLTSWGAVKDALIDLVSNPYLLGCTAIAVLGVVLDPTTRGLKDSAEALAYKTPKG